MDNFISGDGLGDAVGLGVIVTKALTEGLGSGELCVFAPKVALVSMVFKTKNGIARITTTINKGRGWLVIFLTSKFDSYRPKALCDGRATYFFRFYHGR